VLDDDELVGAGLAEPLVMSTLGPPEAVVDSVDVLVDGELLDVSVGVAVEGSAAGESEAEELESVALALEEESAGVAMAAAAATAEPPSKTMAMDKSPPTSTDHV
jgi:hypothetical protein